VYLSSVLSGRISAWISLLAITFMAGAPLLHADDTTPASSSGYKTVPIKVGGKTVPFRVQQQTDPLKNVSMSDPLDSHRAFSATNDMANKSFSMPVESGTQETSKFSSHEQETFITKSYIPEATATVPNLNSKMNFPSAQGYSRSASGFDKGYAVPDTAEEQGRSAILGSTDTAEEQGRTAILGGSEKGQVLAANSMADKQYLGPGAQKVPDGEEIPENIVVSRVKDLPNRPLTIDEVRNLINHETKPNLEARPETPGKALNDPDYKPQPLRDNPSPSEDDKTDAVPPPGTMSDPQATPENSEPLPQP
jgi:hypothetical protein